MTVVLIFPTYGSPWNVHSSLGVVVTYVWNKVIKCLNRGEQYS